MSDDKTIDLRDIPHQQRHTLIFMTYDHLVPDEGFVIINDHDPAPLRRQFEMLYGDNFDWKYLEQGPQVWRVCISRTAGQTA